MRIVFITTEVAPWSKVGGLADVMGALPEALAARGHQTMTVSPRYRRLEDVEPTGLRVALDLPSGPPDLQRWAALHRVSAGGVVHVFVEHPLFSAGEEIYAASPDPSAGVTTYTEATDTGGSNEGEGSGPGVELQYSVLCQAALAGPLLLWGLEEQRAAAEALGAQARALLALDLAAKRSGGNGGGAETGTRTQGSLNDPTEGLLIADQAPKPIAQAQPLDPQPGERELLQAAAALGAGAPTVFVANDWPATLALLRLRYCVRRGIECEGDGSDGGSVGSHGCSGGSTAEADGKTNEDGDDNGGTAGVAALARALHVGLRRAVGALCIHNLAYQGVLSARAFAGLALPEAARAALATEADWREVLQGLADGDVAGAAASDTTGDAAQPACGRVPNEGQPRRSTGALLAPAPPGPVPAGSPRAGRGPGSSVLTLQRPASAARGAGHRAFATGVARGGGETGKVDAGAARRPPPNAPADSPLNLMRGGILAADGVITVSPGYAQEVISSPHFGCGLDAPLAARGVAGVLNGLDTEVWDPAGDALLPRGCRYAAGPGARAAKAAAKAALQARLGLRIDADAPLFCFVGRLTQQKGVDVLLAALPAVMAGKPVPVPASAGGNVAPQSTAAAAAEPAVPGLRGTKPPLQVAMLGQGEAWMEEALKGLDQSFPGQAAGLPLFSEELAHWLMAGSDFVIVPSRFEPCGLVAPCAMHYGALPIVARTGGLQDMVDEKARVGFTVPRLGSEASAVDVRQDVLNLVSVMRTAAAQYGSPGHAKKMSECMARDVSWAVPAVQWEAWLRTLLT